VSPAAQAPHLILIPGLMCDSAVWEHQARALAALTTIDIADHGTLDSLGKMADAVLERAPARFALAGHSMGGRVAFEVLRRAPERVAGAALLDTAYAPLSAGREAIQETAGRYALLEIARKEGMRAMGTEWVRKMVHPDRLSDRPLLDSILTMIARKTPDIFAAQIKALLERPDAAPLLEKIQCPTLILCGRQDAWSGLPRHEEMAERVRGSRLVVIEECGHMSTMERPEAVTVALRDWLLAETKLPS
jgi:pimeloyl-ACP methyl ester carboxylesterase